MTDTYTIADAAVENVTPNWTILRVTTECGREIEINLEHHEYRRQEAGQKAFAFLAKACDIIEPIHSSALFHGKTLSRRAWEEVDRLANGEKPKVRRFAAVSLAVRCAPTVTETAAAERGGRFVYVISCITDRYPLCKIGIARSPEKRINNLSTSSPHPLRLEFARFCEDAPRLERAAHERFGDRRRNGEWFAMEPDEAIEFVVAATRKAA